jgi:hypothetical protein
MARKDVMMARLEAVKLMKDEHVKAKASARNPLQSVGGLLAGLTGAAGTVTWLYRFLASLVCITTAHHNLHA